VLKADGGLGLRGGVRLRRRGGGRLLGLRFLLVGHFAVSIDKNERKLQTYLLLRVVKPSKSTTVQLIFFDDSATVCSFNWLRSVTANPTKKPKKFQQTQIKCFRTNELFVKTQIILSFRDYGKKVTESGNVWWKLCEEDEIKIEQTKHRNRETHTHTCTFLLSLSLSLFILRA
jgi:hypothetical protein